MKYAVLEWDKDVDTDVARVIATNQTKESADMAVKVCPPHFEREAITMAEYQKLREEEAERQR
ncbi:hypothetical protein [Paenibacillus macerans]|uniref:hypothetical protein n=1 Tax=Paenibacillus macerans TaxID=44252 RepID=UPI00203CBF2D|nr:hypothetical protein [Paenibacillus macerans]MCM3699213.1 hypothetical protein [Paenibacillus macerans]